jgi:uncharacterized repeat protein (TIGR03803 family)
MRFQKSLFVRYGWLAIFVAILLFAGSALADASEYRIYTFPTSTTAGEDLSGNLITDGAGNLYGTTSSGGDFDHGVVYELLRPVPPSTAWTQTVLYSFKGSPDGAEPLAGLVFDHSGNLYGTTTQGGTVGAVLGTVFELSPPVTAGGQWTESVLHSFADTNTDGFSPVSGVVFDSAGNLYGTTVFGGPSCTGSTDSDAGCGSVFQLTPPATSGGAWTETIIHFFHFAGGIYPTGTPIFDSFGYLYGTARQGGAGGHGTVYRLQPPATAGGAWTYRVLYAFAGQSDSIAPEAALTLHEGTLYGTAAEGGTNDNGTVFQLVPPAVAGDAWTENILYHFAGGNDGSFPAANVIFDRAGNLYSTTVDGGGLGSCDDGNCGTVFELTPPTSEEGNWTETILHAFGAADDALNVNNQPVGGVVFGPNDILFGAAQNWENGSDGNGSGPHSIVFAVNAF